jgi:hypothetical protein
MSRQAIREREQRFRLCDGAIVQSDLIVQNFASHPRVAGAAERFPLRLPGCSVAARRGRLQPWGVPNLAEVLPTEKRQQHEVRNGSGKVSAAPPQSGNG